MTPDAAEIKTALADVLAAHEGCSFDLTTPRAYTQHGGWNASCECGVHLCSHSEECKCHLAHVAAALLPLVTQAQAEAWDAGRAATKGWVDEAFDDDVDAMPNPYRARADERGI